ncbi:hypothetical protein BDZ89DRAFT_1148153 [Hymenopellis radicata]|nr:hypothetical protein BDZ89DRAFT_1148153 [Hymenopellis radicata]
MKCIYCDGPLKSEDPVSVNAHNRVCKKYTEHPTGGSFELQRKSLLVSVLESKASRTLQGGLAKARNTAKTSGKRTAKQPADDVSMRTAHQCKQIMILEWPWMWLPQQTWTMESGLSTTRLRVGGVLTTSTSYDFGARHRDPRYQASARAAAAESVKSVDDNEDLVTFSEDRISFIRQKALDFIDLVNLDPLAFETHPETGAAPAVSTLTFWCEPEASRQEDRRSVIREAAVVRLVRLLPASTYKKPRKLVKDEHRETGGVKWNIYKKYLQASSYFIWSILLFLVFFNQGLGIVEKLWIKFWDIMRGAFSHGLLHHHSAGPVYSTRTLPDAREHPLFYVGVYAAIGIGSAMVGVVSSAAQLRASRILFKQLLVTVVRATFRFHDTTPQGRMLNQFGKDIETIDSSLAGSMQAVNSSLASFFVSILNVAVVFPAFLIPAVPLDFVYKELLIGYSNTGLLEGIVTVRAFSAEKRFLDGLHRKVDTTTKMWYGFWMTNRWLLLNFDCVGAVSFTCLFSIAILVDGAGLAGLCITTALSFTTSVYWACRFCTGLELDLNSVERIVEYLDLPQEPPAVIESSRPPAYWPSSTTNDNLVTVENLVVKYGPP